MSRGNIAPLIQGMIHGMLMREDSLLYQPKIHQDIHEDGYYEPFFYITTFSGHTVKITVEEVTDEKSLPREGSTQSSS